MDGARCLAKRSFWGRVLHASDVCWLAAVHMLSSAHICKCWQADICMATSEGNDREEQACEGAVRSGGRAAARCAPTETHARPALPLFQGPHNATARSPVAVDAPGLGGGQRKLPLGRRCSPLGLKPLSRRRWKRSRHEGQRAERPKVQRRWRRRRCERRGSAAVSSATARAAAGSTEGS